MRWFLALAFLLAIAPGASAQAIYGQAPAPIVIAQSGVAVTNTGIGTAEVNMASIALPPLGPDDAVRITALFDTSGSVASDAKNIVFRLSSSGCAQLSACTSGTSILQNNWNTSSLIAGQAFFIVRNAGATNAQVSGYIGAFGNIGIFSVSPVTASIETSAGAYLNIDSATTTASTDTIKLLGYTVEVIRGR